MVTLSVEIATRYEFLFILESGDQIVLISRLRLVISACDISRLRIETQPLK